MAEEEISELEEEDVSEEEQDSQDNQGLETVKSKKKLIIIALVALVSLLIIIIFALSGSDEMEDDFYFSDELDASLGRKIPVPPSQLEQMIKKANVLYAQGNSKEALHLFKEIATHSEAISFYNLGVARMKNEQFQSAIEAFKKAMSQNDKVCVSAINAAVCALRISKIDLYQYYIDLAAANLQSEHDSPLYSYYQSLIEFYRNRPLESLASLEHPSSDYFKEEQDYLHAKIAFILNDPSQSSSYLEQVINDDDLGALGMLYARMGNLNLAKSTLLKALDGGYAPIKNSLALGHIYLKSGLIQEASQVYKTLYDSDLKNYTTIYPIRVTLNPKQFDLKIAQEAYKNSDHYNKRQNLEILLHFAPFKIFDAMNTLSYIKKGSANIYIDDIQSAKLYLSKAGNFSKVNKVIALAIKDAVNHQLYKALEKFSSLIKIYPKHAILNYNIALTYAKLGNLKQANHFFSKSYNLDAKNYMAGIFAINTGKLIGKAIPKQTQLFKENLSKEIETADVAFIKALLDFSGKNFTGVIQWSEEQQINSNIKNAMMLLTHNILGQNRQAKAYAKKMITKNKHDVLAQLLYIHATFKELDNKNFAIKSLDYLRNLHLSLNDIFYGSHITKKLFIHYTFTTGHLFDLSQKLQEQIAVENKNIIGILQALAYSKIYLKQFEEAYVLYNQLIDEHKQRDSKTLFNAALAATGSNHHGNAIALLELANLKNRFNDESRYALGLLYLENKNYNAAATQFSKILTKDFRSKHFTFDIDSKSLGKKLIEIEDEI